jgi:hypothetical protein
MNLVSSQELLQTAVQHVRRDNLRRAGQQEVGEKG